jgi:shikimate dehydrogenase
MSGSTLSGSAKVAGVIGRPIAHSLSPTLHNAWIASAGLDAVYAPFSTPESGFAAFVEGCRGGVICGLNVTLPFKANALAIADHADAVATRAGAANLLLFHADGEIEARNTDGIGLLYALNRQAPSLDPAARPVAILGAGGAARGAVAALEQAGATDIRIVNRTVTRAEALASVFPCASAWSFDRMDRALQGVGLIVNATSAEVAGGEGLQIDISAASADAVVMDMLYKPLKTRLLQRAEASGLAIVDGLDMLVGQAIPSFEALFGIAPPGAVDARALLLNALGQTP